MNIQSQVLKLITFISNDPQFKVGSPDYLGYMNCHEDGFLDADNQEAFRELVENMHYYRYMLYALGLNVEVGFDLDETIFILK